MPPTKAAAEEVAKIVEEMLAKAKGGSHEASALEGFRATLLAFPGEAAHIAGQLKGVEFAALRGARLAPTSPGSSALRRTPRPTPAPAPRTIGPPAPAASTTGGGDIEMKAPWTHIRFGAPPAGGRSYNYRDAFYEKGVSAYRLLAGNPPRVEPAVSSAIGIASGLEGRPIWLLRAQEIGIGSDGEPVVRILAARLAPRTYTVEFPIVGAVGQPRGPRGLFHDRMRAWGLVPTIPARTGDSLSIQTGEVPTGLLSRLDEPNVVIRYSVAPTVLWEETGYLYDYARMGVRKLSMPGNDTPGLLRILDQPRSRP